jgi:acyl-CoA thioester hydrolase
MTLRVPSRAFELTLRVGPGDIDVQDHVSNVAVVSWMNQAAWRHSQALGFDAAHYRGMGAMWVVRRHEIDYLRQAVLGDELICRTWPSALSKAAAERRHRIERVADGAVIATGLNLWAFIDASTGRPMRIPESVRAAFDPERFV